MRRPLCECHDEPMLWKTDLRRKAKGSWVCHVRRKEMVAKYNASLKGKARRDHYLYNTAKGQRSRRVHALRMRTKERRARIERREKELSHYQVPQ